MEPWYQTILYHPPKIQQDIPLVVSSTTSTFLCHLVTPAALIFNNFSILLKFLFFYCMLFLLALWRRWQWHLRFFVGKIFFVEISFFPECRLPPPPRSVKTVENVDMVIVRWNTKTWPFKTAILCDVDMVIIWRNTMIWSPEHEYYTMVIRWIVP